MIELLFGLFLGVAQAQPAPSDYPGCVYRSAVITLTNRQTTTIQCDVNGKIRVH